MKAKIAKIMIFYTTTTQILKHGYFEWTRQKIDQIQCKSMF